MGITDNPLYSVENKQADNSALYVNPIYQNNQNGVSPISAADPTLGEPESESGILDELKNAAGDIGFALINPEIRRANMRVGLEKGLAGLQQMRADELTRQGEFGLYDSGYVKEVQRSATKLSDAATALDTGINETFKPKSATGQFLKSLERSAPATLATVATSVVAGPAAGYSVGSALGAGQVLGEKYGERRDMLDTPEEALNGALIHSVAEGVFELVPLPMANKLFKAIKSGNPMLKASIGEMFAEGVQESATGIVQGLEDSWRGQGKDPAGLQGVKDYVTSGAILQDVMQNFAGGVLMSGAVDVSILKPIQMSYKPAAIESVKDLDRAIKAAEANGSATVDVAGAAVPIEELKIKMGETIETFGIKPEEWVEPTLGVAEQDQERFDGAIAGLKELVVNQPAVEEVIEKETDASPETIIEPLPQTTTIVDERTGQVVKETSLTSGVRVSASVPQAFGQILDDIYKDLAATPDLSIYDLKDTASLPSAMQTRVATIQGARLFNRLKEDGSREYVVVGNFGKQKNTWKASLIMHEALGHIIDYEFSDKAPQAIKDLIDKRFEEFIKDRKPVDFLSPDILMQLEERGVDSAALTEKNLANARNEAELAWRERQKREWKAQQISAAMQKRPEVRSVIERHWASLYEKLKSIYAKFKENFFDVSENVGSMDEFVDWLYSTKGGTVEAAIESLPDASKINVENFNTKLNPLAESIFNSLFEMVDGKRRVKDTWKFKRIYKDGRTGSVSRRDIQQTGFNYREVGGKTLVLKGKDTVLFTIPWDHSRGLSKDTARKVAVNIRDLLVITALKTPASARTPKRSEAYNSLVRIIDERAKVMAAEEGISENQARLNIMSGQGSAFSKLTPGILGTPSFTDTQANRTLKHLERSIQKFQSEFPGLFHELYGDLQAEAGIAVDSVKEAIVDDAAVEPKETLQPTSTVDEVTSFVSAIVDDWYNRPKPSERVQDFDQLVEKVIFYFDYKGKDYTEVSAEIRNLINATIKNRFEELSGLHIQKAIRNKAVAVDQVLELRKAGMDSTVSDIELMQIAQDMGMFDESDFIVPYKKASEAGLGILGSYIDPTDKRHKAVLSSLNTGWLVEAGESAPGSGKIPKSWESRLDNLSLGDIWQAEGLYTLYPGLANISVELYNDPDSDVAGSSSWWDRYIRINYARGQRSVLDTIVHELQHQIQGIEDFPGGSSDTAMEKAKKVKFENLQESIQLLAMARTIKKQIKSGGVDYAVSMAARLSGTKSQLADSVLLRLGNGSIDTVISEMEQEVATQTKEWEGIKDSPGYKLYRQTAGEDEARRASAMFIAPDSEVIVELGKKGVTAYSDLAPGSKKIRTDARSGKVNLNAISTVDETSNDELTFASYEAIYEDDLAMVDKVRVRKPARSKIPPVMQTGPYAEMLRERIKAKKVKKASDVSPEKLAKRQQRNADFIAKMDIIRDRAEKTGKSMAEVMISAGFEKRETRRAITKYHSLKSKFTQNEMIIRLAEVAGLINEETGREGLTGLIQSMFPAQSYVDTDSDGKPQKITVEGSNGTLQSLTAISKDILINQIQNIILSKQGYKYDIESEQTLAELGETYRKDYEKQSGFSKTFKFIKLLQSGAADYLMSTPTGRKLHFQLRKFLLTKTVMQRDYLVRLNKFGQEYDTQEKRARLYEVISGKEPVADAKEAQFVSLIKAINRVYGKESEALGVKIYRKGGSFRYFKYDKDTSDLYFPHMWRPEWFSNPTDAMIQSLLDANEAADKQQAKKIIQMMGKDRIRVQKFSNIEMERETNLGGWITDPIEVYTKYVQSASRRLAALKTFGESPEVTLAQYAVRHFKDSKDPDSFTKTRDLINRVLGNRVDDALLVEAKSMLSLGVMLSVGLMLQHSLLVQPGVLFNAGAVGGYRNLVKATTAVLPSLWGNANGANSKRWAELAGVLAFTVNRELNDIVMEDQARVTTDKVLRSFGITQMDSFLRIISAVTGKLYATDVALNYLSNPNKKDAQRLVQLGIDPADITEDYLQSTRWFAHDLRMAALAFTEDTNFVLDPMRTPAMLQGHPLLKIFMLFKNFSFQQHRLIMKLLRDREFGKFIGVLLGSLVGGSVINLFRMLVKGEDPEKVLKEDGYARTVWRGFMAGGGAGIFAEAFGNAATMSSGRMTGGSPLSLDSPAGGLLEQIGKATGSLYDIAAGDADEGDMNNLYRSGSMLMQGILLSATPNRVGVPLNAAVGMTRPMLERVVAPSKTQSKKSLFE